MSIFYRSVLGAGLMLLASAATAQGGTSGWYVGIGAGGANYSDDIPRQIAAAYRGNHIYTLQSARMTDSRGTVAQAFAGYRFLPWLGVELAYQDLGHARSLYRLDTVVQLNYPMPTLSGEYGLRDVNAVLVGTWPLSEHFELLARGGASQTRLSYDEHGFDINAKPYAFHARTRTRTGAVAGIGAAWNFTPSLALRFDIDRTFGVGKTFALDVEGNGHFDHVDAYTVNLVWRP